MKMYKIITVAMTCLISAQLSFANNNKDDSSVVTIVKVYNTPLKYIDNYQEMVNEGKLISKKVVVKKAQNIYKFKNNVVIFSSNDKYQNINVLLQMVKDYAKKLENIDNNKVDRVINLLKFKKETEQ